MLVFITYYIIMSDFTTAIKRLQQISTLSTDQHASKPVCTRLRATFCYCRYKAVERLAAEEFERERPRAPTRGRTEITLCLSPNPASRSLTRCTTPSSIVSQEDTIACTAHETSGKRCPPIIYSSWVSERWEHEWTVMLAWWLLHRK